MFSSALHLCNSNSPLLVHAAMHGVARDGQEGRHTHTATADRMIGECGGGKDQTDRNLDIENNRHTRCSTT